MPSIVVVVTDTAKKNISDMLVIGRGFQVTHFEVGSGGHDPLDVNIALTPDPTLTTLPQKTFGPKAITSATVTSLFSSEFTATLLPSEGIGVLSNIGLIATVISSLTPGDPLVGTTFLFAVGNMPFRTKLDSENIIFDLTLLY